MRRKADPELLGAIDSKEPNWREISLCFGCAVRMDARSAASKTMLRARVAVRTRLMRPRKVFA